MSLALIDADILVFRIGYSSDDSDEAIALWRLDSMLESILAESGKDAFRCFLTAQDKSNFRFDVDPMYKSHRVIPKPRHYLAIRERLILEHKAEVIRGMEADDALGIAQDETTVICTIDKDLDQVPGEHFNFVKHIKYNVTEVEGMRWFYKQMVLGDNADGIKGINGIGPKKAERYFDKLTTEEEMYNMVKTLYKREYTEPLVLDTALLKAGQLLKIRQSESEGLWYPPGNELRSMEDTGVG